MGPLEGHFKAALISVDCSFISLERGLYKPQKTRVVIQGALCEREKSRDGTR